MFVFSCSQLGSVNISGDSSPMPVKYVEAAWARGPLRADLATFAPAAPTLPAPSESSATTSARAASAASDREKRGDLIRSLGICRPEQGRRGRVAELRGAASSLTRPLPSDLQQTLHLY